MSDATAPWTVARRMQYMEPGKMQVIAISLKCSNTKLQANFASRQKAQIAL